MHSEPRATPQRTHARARPQMLQIVVDPSDTVSHTVLMYGVVGPVVDLLWGTWPGNGATMLLVSQTVFSVRFRPREPLALLF